MCLCKRDLSKECEGKYRDCTDCVLDKIRAEIEKLRNFRAENYDLEEYCDYYDARIIFRENVFDILDKYEYI